MTGTNRVDTVFAFGLLAVVSGAFFGSLLPQIKQRRVLAAEARELEDTLSTSYRVSMDLKEIEDEIARIRSRLQDFDTRHPSATEIDKFLAQLSSIAARCDVQVDLVKPGRIEVRSLHAELPVSLEANCRFADLYRFLYELHAMPRLTKPATLRVTTKRDCPKCKVELTLLIYLCRTGV